MGSPERKRGVPIEGLQIIFILLTIIIVDVVRHNQGETFADAFSLVIVGLLLLGAVVVLILWRRGFNRIRALDNEAQDRILSGLAQTERWELLTSLGREVEAAQSEVQPEVQSEEFSISRGYKLEKSFMFWLMLTLSLLVIAAIALKSPSREREWTTAICVLAVAGLIGTFSFVLRRQANHRVEINSKGISQVFDSGKGYFIEWNEIVKARNRPLLRRIDLHSADGTTIIRLKFQLESFHKLRAIVLAKTGLKC